MPYPYKLFTKQWYRGFDKSLDEESVLDAWGRGDTSLAIPSTRFVTLGSALASEERFIECWRQWVTTPRELKLIANGTKRADIINPLPPHQSLQKTRPRSNPHLDRFKACKHLDFPDTLLSAPHNEEWSTGPSQWELSNNLEYQTQIELQEGEW